MPSDEATHIATIRKLLTAARRAEEIMSAVARASGREEDQVAAQQINHVATELDKTLSGLQRSGCGKHADS